MSIQKVPLATLQKIRQYLQPLLAVKAPQPIEGELPLPDSIEALGDLFASGGFTRPETSRWNLSAVNPAIVLSKLPLTLQSSYRWVSYLWQDERGSRGVIWAVPTDRTTTAELEQVISSVDANYPPQPQAALADFMQAIDGDRSPGSFLIASLLRRELQNWGTTGAYCDWNHHHLIEAVPAALQQQAGQLQNLSPRLRLLPDRRVAVEFFTCRVVAPVTIFRHVDLYSAVNYTANSLDRAMF